MMTLLRRKWLNFQSNHSNKEHLSFTKIVMVGRLRSSCGAAGALRREEQIRQRLVGPHGERDSPILEHCTDGGRQTCQDQEGAPFWKATGTFPCWRRRWENWGIKRGRAAVTASRRPAPSSKAQHQNPTLFCISFPSAQPLHVRPGGPGSGNPKDPVGLLTSPGSAGVRYLESRGEALSNYRFSISVLGLTLSRLKVTLLTNFFSLAV